MLSTQLLRALSKLFPAHQKHTNLCRRFAMLVRPRPQTIVMLLVDRAGSAPASRTPFTSFHTAITYIVYLFLYVVNIYII